MRNLYETVQEATGCYKCIYRFISSFAFGDIVCIELYIPRSERFEGRGEESGSEGGSGPDSGSKMGRFRIDFGVEIGSASVSLACDEWFENVVNCGGIVKKRGFGLTLTPSNLDLWGSQTEFRIPLFRFHAWEEHRYGLPRLLPRLMKSKVNSTIIRLFETSSAPGFRACNRPKRGRAIWRGSLGQRHNGSKANLVTGANENRNRRSGVAKNEEMLTLSWTALEARSSIPHASPEECLDGTPWEAQSRKPRLRGKDLGSGCLRKDGFDARLERHRAGEGYSYGCPVF